MLSASDVADMCAKPHETLVDALSAAVEITRVGRWAVILTPPVWRAHEQAYQLGQVVTYRTAVHVGYLTYMDPGNG